MNMKAFRKRMWVMASAFFITFGGYSQPQSDQSRQAVHHVYLIGNVADCRPSAQSIEALSNLIKHSDIASTVLFTGDILGKNGMDGSNMPSDSAYLRKLTSISNIRTGIDVHFLFGDRDWDNSGENGWEYAKAMEKFVEKKLDHKQAFRPSKGCPGPEFFDVGDYLRVILINTQWLLHRYVIPQAPATDCKVLTAEDFWEELESLIDESKDRNILIAGHHPIYSNGPYGGKRMWKKHLFPLTDASKNFYLPLPIIGSFYAAFRQNVGSPGDMIEAHYDAFVHKFRELLYDYHPLIYAAGHAYNMELVLKEGNYHINSGSTGKSMPAGSSPDTEFSISRTGFIRLSYFQQGMVTLQAFEVRERRAVLLSDKILYASACTPIATEGLQVNESYMPCKEVVVGASVMNAAFRDSSAIVVAGAEYLAGRFKQFWLGSHYRESWAVPVRASYLDLDRKHGGLIPFELGGGRQTTSLKFLAGNGNEYVFRSVNKNPVKALPHDLRGTIVENIIRDQTSTQHPYGALVVSKLMDATDILHAKPELFILPDDPKLGQWQYLGGLFGMLEDRPKGPAENREGFAGSDDVDRSFKMLRKVYGDNDNSIDPQAYARARIFDIYIGDWGRHEDNWKWAGFDNGKGLTYYPIPRDRDHAFSRWDGFFPWIADREWARSNSEDFSATFKMNGIRSLTWPARHLDRLVGADFDGPEWIAESRYLAERMTDQVIEDAVKALPPEDYEVIGSELETKLKARRDQLEAATKQFYKLLAKQVDVVGSNKREIFEVERLESGDVKVAFYKKKKTTGDRGRLMYDRLFRKGETREIRLFGLAGADDFTIRGSSRSSILVRVIGGADEDRIEDQSDVRGWRKMTRIYDARNEDLVMTGTEARLKQPAEAVRYDRTAFKYNTYLPLPIISYSGDDGFGIGAGVSWTIHKFLKPDFARKHSISMTGTTRGTIALNYNGRHRHALGKADFLLHASLGTPVRDYPDFYGIGNETAKVDSLFAANFYRNEQNKIEVQPSLSVRFLRKSAFFIGLHYEYSNVAIDEVVDEPVSRLLQTMPGIEGAGENQFGGSFFGVDLDFRDKKQFTLNGLRLFLEHRSYLNFSDGSKRLGRSVAHLSFYQTARIGIPVTFIVKGGIADTYGDVPFYYLSTLGQTQNLRGYFRNRFAGNTAAWFNSELRFQVTEIPTPILPLKFGLIGFYDLGRVWVDGDETGSDKLHMGYGGGFYLAPYEERFAFTVSLAHSEEEKILVRLGFGFLLQ